jgi:hypothetical protein
MITIDVLANYCFVFFQEGDKMQKMSALANLQVIDNINWIGAHCIIIDSRTGYPIISGCQVVCHFIITTTNLLQLIAIFFYEKIHCNSLMSYDIIETDNNIYFYIEMS